MARQYIPVAERGEPRSLFSLLLDTLYAACEQRVEAMEREVKAMGKGLRRIRKGLNHVTRSTS